MNLNLEEIQMLSVKGIAETRLIQKFKVAEYQRGYKWGRHEIISLLNDVYYNNHDIYCLQPLVVHALDNEGTFELIDGQQRSTTIFLILCILKDKYGFLSELPYEIIYNTRETSAVFLDLIAQNRLFSDDYILVSDENVMISWKQYAKDNPDNDNIDNFHFFQAYHLICNWLNVEKAYRLLSKLWNQTFFIWYPVRSIGENQSAKQIFLNLNSGKIGLTSAELIKALFILKIDQGKESFDIRQFKRNEFAQEWDEIERKLHKQDFWYFVTNKANENYQTRIGILFDLKWEEPKEKNDNYAYDNYVAEPEKLNWDEIKGIFNKIEEWYNEVHLYHRIGFIINIQLLTLREVIGRSKGKTKSEFILDLEDLIKAEVYNILKGRDKVSLDKLDYAENPHNCRFILLLYNVMSLERIFAGQRFPYDLYQIKHWTVEHIHPQNPRELESVDDLLEWLSDYSNRLEDDSLASTTLNELRAKIYETNKISKEVSNDVKEFVESVKEELKLHKIGNLALLDDSTNSSIGNNKFTKKRSEILKRIKKPVDLLDPVYIPLCTVNNFLKSTTLNENNIQMNFWSDEDAAQYVTDIELVLANYLPKIA